MGLFDTSANINVHADESACVTHVRMCCLLDSQHLVLDVGRGHLHVKHWLKPGGASIDPLTPVITLINTKHSDNNFLSCTTVNLLLTAVYSVIKHLTLTIPAIHFFLFILYIS